ncbi:MAG TPA: metallophosphoesterase family protein [Planktothrix sp.]
MHVAYRGEWIIILGFVGAFIALYSAAIFLLIRPFISPMERVPPLGGVGKMILGFAALGLVLAAYAFFIEPMQLDVTHLSIPIDGLSPSAAPIRIVQFSDTHCDATARLEPRLPEEIRKQKPDLIFFTGDACNSEKGFENWRKCIEQVKQIAPLFACKGDWDVDANNINSFGRVGLTGEGTKLVDVRGQKLFIIQVPAIVGASARAAANKAPKGMPVIMLAHSPDQDVVITQDMRGIDLLCVGHTHGGQIALPFYGALITQAKTGRAYSRGLSQIGNGWIYTNRGIGMEGHFPRVRFCSVPELTVFDLVPSGKPWHG